MTSRLTELVLDCHDPERLAAFWCAVLDEWNSANAFAARVRNLKDGLGGNAHNSAAFLLPKVRHDRSAAGRAR